MNSSSCSRSAGGRTIISNFFWMAFFPISFVTRWIFTVGSDLIRRSLMYTAYLLLPRCFSKIIVDDEQIATVKNTIRDNLPVILLPVYRCTLDYFFIVIMFYVKGIPLPLILKHKNENIRMSWFQKILGVKIRTIPEEDHLRFNNYLSECLREGVPLMFHLEEYPKINPIHAVNGDPINFLIQACETGYTDDVRIGIMSINYDLIPVDNFKKEIIDAKRNNKLTLVSKFMSTYRCLSTQHGDARITMLKPYSLIEQTRSFCLYYYNNPVTDYTIYPLYGSIMSNSERNTSDRLINRIVYDQFHEANVIMPTNILGSVLLRTTDRKHFTFNQLYSEFSELCFKLKDNGLLCPVDSTSTALRNSMKLFRPFLHIYKYENRQVNTIELMNMDVSRLLRNRGYFVEVIWTVKNIQKIEYLADVFDNAFVLEAIVVLATAKLSDVDQHYASIISVGHRDIVRKSIRMCCIMQYEYPIIEPSLSLFNKIEDTIRKLCSRSILKLYDLDNNDCLSIPRCKKTFKQFSSFYKQFEPEHAIESCYRRNDYYTLEIDSKQCDKLLSRYLTLYQPKILAYYGCAQTLDILKTGNMLKRNFIDLSLQDHPHDIIIQEEKRAKLNALKLFRKWGVINYAEREDGYIGLDGRFLNDDQLTYFVREIGSFTYGISS